MSAENKANALRYLIELDGWRIIEQYIADRIEDHKGQLMNCPLEDVTKHREAVKALNGVFIFVKKTIEEGMNEH